MLIALEEVILSSLLLGIIEGRIWSASEASAEFAWMQGAAGNRGIRAKSEDCDVYCVRR